MRTDNLKNEFLGGKRLKFSRKEEQDYTSKHLRRLDTGADIVKIDSRNIVLASLLPDEIISKPEATDVKSYIVVLLLGDITGFTDLCDKFARAGKGKTSHMTEIINAYIGEMVKVIYEFRGDVLNFSGDAYLAMWKISAADNYFDVIEKVIDCALYIQRYTGNYETEVNVLSVKLAISLGKCFFLWLGDERRKDFILYGQAVVDVKESAHYCDSTEIIISSNAWLNCNSLKYRHEPHPNGTHIKITGYSKIWSDLEEGRKWEADKTMEKSKNIQHLYKLRPMLKYAADHKLEDVLKIYMMPPVIKALDINQSVEYLTEMRQVVTVFLNIITEEGPTEMFTKVVNECYTTITSIVEAYDGTLNKVSLFDKDFMFLIIFGLRYFTQTMVAQTALKCAIALRSAVQDIQNVKVTSVGVTTGIVYCGIVGHAIRREYTVMGLSVNKAARLMIAYEGIVTCDRETFLYSRMEYENFTLQEPKELKGISNVGPVYKYTQKRVETEKKYKSGSLFPLLGREREIALYKKIVFEKIKCHNLRTIKNVSSDVFNIMTIAFLGETRQGKSRILDEINLITQNIAKTFSFNLTSDMLNIPYSLIRNIIYRALTLNKNSNLLERELIIQSKFQSNTIYYNYLCAMNEILNVKFSETDNFNKLSKENKKKITSGILYELISACFNEVTVITIDDAEFTDTKSWKLLKILAKQKTVLVAMTIGSRIQLTSNAKVYLLKKFVLGIKLTGIHKWYHIGLACQILEVIAIPNSVLRFIQKESNGNPGWIESYLLSSIQSGFLYIKTCPLLNLPSINYLHSLVIVPQYMIENNLWLNIHIQLNQWTIYLDPVVKKHSVDFDIFNTANLFTLNRKKTVAICLMQGKIVEGVPQTMDTLLLMIFDNLPPFLQLFLKCCSSLGETFTRQAVTEILQNVPNDMTTDAIKNLFDLKILGCASERKVLRGGNKERDRDNDCYCNESSTSQEHTSETVSYKYSQCQFLRFRSSSFRETTYALLTNQEKKIYHSRILLLNKKNLKRCTSCHSLPFFEVFLQRELKKELVEENMYLYDLVTRLTMGEELFKAEKATQICTSSILEGMALIVNCTYESPILSKPISSEFYNPCYCREILYNYYLETIKHSIIADELEQTLNLILSFIPILISLSNITLAFKTIEKAQILLEKCRKLILYKYKWKIQCAEGILKMYSAACYFEVGEINEAEQELIKAMKELGTTYPKNIKEMLVKLNVEMLKLRIFAVFMEKSYKKKYPNDKSYLTKFFSTQCLNLMFSISLYKQHWPGMLLCATWSLHRSLRTAIDFRFISVSVSNFFSIGNLFYKSVSLLNALDNICMKMCSLKATNMPEREKQCIANIYTSLFTYRINKAKINEAVDIGTVIVNFTLPLERTDISSYLFPWLAYLHMTKLQFDDMLSLFADLKNSVNPGNEHITLSWYYICVIYLNLSTGMDFANYQELEDFIHNNYFKIYQSKYSTVQNIFTMCLWLLCERSECWNISNIWLPQKLIAEQLNRSDIFEINLSLEGLLMHLCKSHFTERSLQCFRLYRNLAKSVEKVMHLLPIIKPRYYHLKAWFKYIYFFHRKAITLLRKAKESAKKQSNYLELIRIEFTETLWYLDQKARKKGRAFKPKMVQRKVTLARPLAFEQKIIKELVLTAFPLPKQL